jgi:hypothetical protein
MWAHAQIVDSFQRNYFACVCGDFEQQIRSRSLPLLFIINIIIIIIIINEELIDPYSSPNIVRVIKSRRMRWAGHVARMGERRGAYRVLVEKPEGRRPLGRPRHRWEG